MNLPYPEIGKNDKETVNNLFDTVIKLRKELQYTLMHLDEDNIPGLSEIVTDVAGNTAQLLIQAGQISTLVTDVAGNSSSITQQAGQISTLVSDVSGQQSLITQLSGEISLKVSDSDITASLIISRINGGTARINAANIDLIGATTFRQGINTDYIQIGQNILTFKEYSSGLTKMALGFVPDKNGINVPGIVFGAGDGYGNNRGYITKGTESLDMFHISGSGVVSYISLKDGQIRLNDNIIPVADQNGKLVDDYIYSATTWNQKLDEATMKNNLQNPLYNITIPKENIGVLDENNIQIDYAEIATLVAQDLTVDTAQIVDAAITNAKIGLAAIATANIQDAAISSAKIGLAQINEAHIEDASIGTAKIEDAAITTAKIGLAQITDAHIQNASITAASIALATITNAQILDATIQGAKIANATIGNANIQNATITGAKIAAGTIDTANIKTGAITTALIGTGAIETAQIADASITNAKIVDLSANKINAGTLSTERLVIRGAQGSIVYEINNITGALQALSTDTLNGEILTPRTINADKIIASSITANEIAAQTIVGNNIAANTIEAGHLKVGTITAASGIIASIDAGTITTGTISADRISGGTITGVTININTIATVGDKLQVGGASGIVLERVAFTNELYINAASSRMLRLWSNGMFNDGSIWITNGANIGYHSGMTGSTATSNLRMETGGTRFLRSALLASGTVFQAYGLVRIENNLTFFSGASINVGTMQSEYTTDAGSQAIVFSSTAITTKLPLKHEGSTLSFFTKALVSKQSVTAPSALTMPTTAPSSYTSTWGGQVRTDVNNLRTTVDALRTALVNYGLL